MNQTKPRLLELKHELLTPCRYQMRRQFDPAGLQELADSIKANGLLQPIIVRAISSDQYEIVAGERRWRASQLADMTHIPCLINVYSDKQVAAASIAENINRIDLNPIEEAHAYKRLVDEFNYAHEEVASIVGKSRSTVTNSLRLLKLEQSVQDYLISGALSEGHAKLLLPLPDQRQVFLAKQTVQAGWGVRALQQALVHHRSGSTKGCASDKKDANLARLEEKVALALGCKVGLTHTDKRTVLMLDCHSFEILEGVLEKMQINMDDL